MVEIFESYWWLLFPLGFFVAAGWGSFMRYKRTQAKIDLIKSYTAAGKEPPAALLASLVLRRWLFALVAALLLCSGGWSVVEGLSAEQLGTWNDSDRLRIGLFNVNYGNSRHREIAEYLRDQELDLIVVQEATPALFEELSRAFPAHQRIEHTRVDAFGMAFIARRPITAIETMHWGRLDLPAFEITLELDGRPLYILAIHPIPPTTAGNAWERDLVLARAADWSREHRGDGIIVGDFNATPWSYAFERLVDKSGYVDSRRGHGHQTSWPRGLWPLSIPIDHLLHSPVFTTLSRKTGPFLGSDHRPVLVELGRAARGCP